MKKSKIFLFIVAILLIIVGTIGSAISFKHQEIDTRNKQAFIQKSEPQSNEQLTLNVNSPNHLEIVSTNERFFTLTQKNNKKETNLKWKISNHDQTTEVTLTSSNAANPPADFSIQLFDFPISSSETYQLRVPKQYKQILIKSTTGTININNLETEKLICNSSKNSLNLSDVVANEAELKTTSGNISISDSNIKKNVQTSSTSGQLYINTMRTDELSANATSGSLSIEQIDTRMLNVTTTSGFIRIDNLSNDSKINALATSGDIYLTLPKGISKKEILTKTTSGDVSYDGHFKATQHMKATEHKITATTTSGNIFLTNNEQDDDEDPDC